MKPMINSLDQPVGRAVTRSFLEREVCDSNLRPIKSNTVLPTVRHHCDNCSKGAVLPGRQERREPNEAPGPAPTWRNSGSVKFKIDGEDAAVWSENWCDLQKKTKKRVFTGISTVFSGKNQVISKKKKKRKVFTETLTIFPAFTWDFDGPFTF